MKRVNDFKIVVCFFMMLISLTILSVGMVFIFNGNGYIDLESKNAVTSQAIGQQDVQGFISRYEFTDIIGSVFIIVGGLLFVIASLFMAYNVILHNKFFVGKVNANEMVDRDKKIKYLTDLKNNHKITEEEFVAMKKKTIENYLEK